MKIIVDIDGVICTKTDNLEYYKAKPIKKNIDIINKLFKQGNEIILWTARGTVSKIDFSELTEKQMKKWKVLHHELNFGKPDYAIWLDDKCINVEDIERLSV